MKKILSVVLAVMMIFAVMVPVFAADTDVILDPTKPQTAENEVVVKTSTMKDENTPGSAYVVAIPAETVINWGTGDTTTPLNYTVFAQLNYDQLIKIDVTGTASATTGKYAMGFKSANKTYTLDYTLAGDKAIQDGPVVGTIDAPVTKTLNVNIAGADWAKAPIAAYQDTLTFVVSTPNNPNA